MFEQLGVCLNMKVLDSISELLFDHNLLQSLEFKFHNIRGSVWVLYWHQIKGKHELQNVIGCRASHQRRGFAWQDPPSHFLIVQGNNYIRTNAFSERGFTVFRSNRTLSNMIYEIHSSINATSNQKIKGRNLSNTETLYLA